MGSPEPAVECGLRYVSDDEPGIARRRRGRGFSYHHALTSHVGDRAVLARIAALAIPPAWTDVWICEDETGHIQATGRDAAGRKQYRYHPIWLETRSANKYAQLEAFGAQLPRLREAVLSDLGTRGLSQRKVVATVVWLLDNTMIRVGNDAYAQANESFGLTTLRNRHVEISGGTMLFEFKGKSGQHWRLRLSDRRIARTVRAIQALPGQRLFQFRDENDGRGQVTSQDVNEYIRDVAGDRFSSKDFRTWGGTVRALALLAGTETPETVAAGKRVLNGVLDKVARELGNTRSVCRACYIHPVVIERWADGRLAEEIAALGRVRPRKGLDREETMALRWLETLA